jgi:hypothetical protein
MFKRLFFALLGLGAGVTLGGWAVRKVERTTAKLSPDELARTASVRAGALGARMSDAMTAGRAAAAARESELRAVYRTTAPEDLGE